MNKAASRVEIGNVAEVVVVTVVETAVEIEVVAETANIDLDVIVGTIVDVAVTEAAVGAMIRIGVNIAESVIAAESQSGVLVYLKLKMNSVQKDRALLE